MVAKVHNITIIIQQLQSRKKVVKERNNTCSYLHGAQQRGQCTKSGILIQATWVFVDKMLNCSMMTSKINTEYTEFCRIMKRSRWSGFNNTHQSHYTMTESNRSLPPAYFNLLYTQRVSCHVSTQSTRWRQPPSIMSRTLIMLSTLKRSHSTDYNLRHKTVLLHSIFLRNISAMQYIF